MPSFDCPDCNTNIDGTDCAFKLSRAEGWKNKAGCRADCKCGYPIRAKEIRDNIFSGYIDEDKTTSTAAYIYCETGGGTGHVYYGTYKSCQIGNGLSASGMSSCSVFKRYESAN